MTTLMKQTLHTAEEFLELVDVEGPVELVRGEIVEMPQPKPRHGQVCFKMAMVLGSYAVEQYGHVLTNDVCVPTKRNPDTVRGADICFVSYAKVPKGPIADGFLPTPPDLVVEVPSPSDRWKDILEKVVEYLNAGVTVVCVLDPTTETARIYRSDRDEEQLKNGDLVRFDDVLRGFSVSLKQLFE